MTCDTGRPRRRAFKARGKHSQRCPVTEQRKQRTPDREHSQISGLFFLSNIRPGTRGDTARGFLASISEAALRVAIPAHLPEAGKERGRDRRRERDEKEQEEEEGGGVACSRSVTERRVRERRRDREETTEQRWGPSAEAEVVEKDRDLQT